MYATISAMTIDLAGPAGRYGKLEIPQIKITPTETKIKIKDQKISIIDMQAFHGLTKALIRDDQTTLSLENGNATVKVLGMTFPIKFNKNVDVAGMKGPKTEFIDASENGDTVVAKISNPSPLEMDLGTAVFECRNGDGRALAQQKGKIFITQGESKHEVSMKVTVGDDMENAGDISKLWMVGIDVEGEGVEKSWMRQGIKNYNVELPVTTELRDLIRRKEKEVLDARKA